MFWTNVKRIARSGLVGYFRNGFVSVATILVMTTTLFVFGALSFTNAALDAVLESLTNKVDINVYFLVDAPEDDIQALATEVRSLPEVAAVTYTSRDEALANFKERHQGDQLTLQALDELGDNPLGASIAIRAKDTSQYEGIATYLNSKSAETLADQSLIEKVNFFENKTAIDRLTSIINTAHTLGFAATVFLALIAVLIVFNTIRLAIYTSRDEISVMQLVGASDSYVQGPFLIEGALYGVTGGILSLLIMYPLALYLARPSELFFGNFNTLTHYVSHLPYLFLLLVGSGILLGVLSSFLSVRRYL